MVRICFVIAVLSLVLQGCSHLGQPFSRSSFFSSGTGINTPEPELVLPSLVPQRLPDPILSVNGEVQREIRMYLKGGGQCIRVGLARRDENYQALSEIFEDEGIPLDMLNLAMVESHFYQHAKSNAGAVGMWQFMAPTARIYGLAVSGKRDDRRDPILSTIAAARLLRDLYRQYGDWNLALAAYNAGPASVNRAIARAGTTDFWELARKKTFREQTVRFVPRFIAATLLIKTVEKHGMEDLAANVERTVVAVNMKGPAIRG